MCPCNSHGRENAFPQRWQRHGLVCVRMCIFNAPSDVYVFVQCSHSNNFCAWLFGSAVQWNWRCLVSPECVEYDFEQSAHLYRGISDFMITECSTRPLPGSPLYCMGFVSVVPFVVVGIFSACIILYWSSIDELVDAGDIELRDDTDPPNEFNELWLCVGDIWLLLLW